MAKTEPNWEVLRERSCPVRQAARRAQIIAETAKANARRMRAESDRLSITLAGGDPTTAIGPERKRLIAAGRAMREKARRDNQAAVKGLHARRTREAMPPWADREAIKAIYAEAKRLTEETGIPHEVDHIEPLLGKGASGLHWEGNLRVVTRTTNRRKGNRREIGTFPTLPAPHSR